MANRDSIINAFQEGGKKGKASSLSIEDKGSKGTLLYSYATPIAYRDSKGKIYKNTTKYSPTTSTQQNKIRADESLSASEFKEKLNKDGVSFNPFSR